jgi:hypothetical protein
MKHGRHSLQTLFLVVLSIRHRSTHAEYTRRVSSTSAPLNSTDDGEIRGGTAISPLSWYGVFTQSSVVCGAALIHGDIALTAAHCLDSIPGALRFNSDRRTSGGTEVSVVDARKHPFWNGVITSADLGKSSRVCLFFAFATWTSLYHIVRPPSNSHFSPG